MSLGTFNKCCIFIDLRAGSFIIAYLLLISRAIQFILICFHLAGLNTALNYVNHHHDLMLQDLGFFKLILSFEILLLSFELLITAALLNGLHKKIQEQVQMFYAGGFAFEVLRLIIFAAIILRYGHIMAKLYGSSQWFMIALQVIGHLVYIYFLCAIRSYYFVMRKEDEAKRWNVFTSSQVQLHINK